MLRLYQPCIPTKSKVAPSGPEWVHEIKHDGYRLIARKLSDRVQLITKGGYDWVKRYPWIAGATRALKVSSITIDGEAVVCGPDGVSDFEKLHSRAYDHAAFLYAFDLLELDGEDLRSLPLEGRKAKLERIIRNSGIALNEHTEGDGAEIFRTACQMGLEGIVSKRRDMHYVAGKSKAWLKIKNPNSPAMLRLDDEEWSWNKRGAK
jgi:bifunctional non-homologous end joining protein LigD